MLATVAKCEAGIKQGRSCVTKGNDCSEPGCQAGDCVMSGRRVEGWREAAGLEEAVEEGAALDGRGGAGKVSTREGVSWPCSTSHISSLILLQVS